MKNESDRYAIIMWLIMLKVIPAGRKCTKCAIEMSLKERSDIDDRWNWRCTKCNQRKTARFNSFLSSTNISLCQFINVIFYWGLQTRQIDQEKVIGISRQTIINLQQKLRICVSRALDKDHFQ